MWGGGEKKKAAWKWRLRGHVVQPLCKIGALSALRLETQPVVGQGQRQHGFGHRYGAAYREAALGGSVRHSRNWTRLICTAP